MDETGSAARTDNALAMARAVLERAPVFDGHNDLPWVIRIDKAARGDVFAYALNQVHEKADTDIPRMREGMVGAQFWAAFQPTGAPHPARTALEQIDLIRRIEEAHPDVFLPARRAADYDKAKAAGKIASFIAVEGGVGLENSLAPLRIWHAAGVRLMTLCHNETLDWVEFGDRRAAQRGVQRLRPRSDRRAQPARDRHRPRPCLARRDAARARRDRGAGRAVALQRLFAVRSSAQRARTTCSGG